MDVGLPEILFTIFIIVLAFFIFRVSRMNRHPLPADNPPGSMVRKRKKQEEEPKRNYLGIAGLGLMVVSLILLWSGMRLLKMVFWAYSWFVVLAIIGLALLYLSRRK
jgi:hypothetical protein